jgi:hypothetical protein
MTVNAVCSTTVSATYLFELAHKYGRIKNAVNSIEKDSLP